MKLLSIHYAHSFCPALTKLALDLQVKNKNDLKNENNLKIEDNLKFKECTQPKLIQPLLCLLKSAWIAALKTFQNFYSRLIGSLEIHKATL